MFTIAHIIHQLDVWGPLQIILNLCKFRDRKNRQIVVSVLDGPMHAEIEATGVPVYIEKHPSKIRQLLNNVDLVNFHLYLGKENSVYRTLYMVVYTSKRPHVITLHSAIVLPKLAAAVTIGTSKRVCEMQAPSLNNCVAIPNGVDLTCFYPRHKPVSEKIILTRVCTPRRCNDYFWDAMNIVLTKSNNCELWIVGQEGESSNQIKFLGVRRDVPDILAQTDIFVYAPYPHIGTKELVVMEAMAMGIPCVLSDVPCVHECVQHGVNGLLTPFGDSEKFAEAVFTLIEDSALRKKIGENAAKTAQSEFDIRPVVRQYERIYQSVLENNHH